MLRRGTKCAVVWQPVVMSRVRLLVLAALVVVAAACTAEAEPPAGDGGAPMVRVASGADTETKLLANVAAALLREAGYDVELVAFADSRDSRHAMTLGAVDVRIGYSGESWLESLGRPNPPSDVRESIDTVREHDEGVGIVWLRPRFGDGLDAPPANATFAFVVQGPPSVDADLATMSQLASRLSERPDALVCVDQGFASRSDGLSAVLAAYSVRSDRPFLAATPEEAVLGVAAGECLAGLSTTTDGMVWAYGLRPLVDDLGVFPAFVIAPQIRAGALEADPQIRSALQPMASRLTTAMVGRWNARVLAGEPFDRVGEAAVDELQARPSQ